MISNKYKKLLYYISNNFFFRFVSKKKMGNGIIFCYHRILPQDQININNFPDLGMVTSLENFEEHLKFFIKNYNCVSLDRLLESDINDKNFKICISFDDGYKDNLDYVLPLIEKYKIPITIYISTRFLNDKVYLWWYELWDIINKNLNINFKWYEKNYSFHNETYFQKISCYQNISSLFINENVMGQLKLLEIISNSKTRIDYSSIFISKENLSELDQNPLITLGNHSHNHLCFTKLNNDEIQSEIELSQNLIHNYIDSKIEHFAYPYGQLGDFSKLSSNLIKNYGFKSISTTINKNIKSNSINPYYLPRYGISNQDNLNSISVKISGFQSIIIDRINGIR